MRILATAVSIACALASLAPPGAAGELSIEALERQFRELPSEARRLTGPLFWLHGDESKELLESYVAKVAEGGNGCLTAESRPHNDWLGEGWFRDLGIILAAAKKHNLKLWIFDEKWWPSGEVGGKVPPRYGCKRLVASAKTVTGPARVAEPGFGGQTFVGAVAGKTTAAGIDGSTLIDLAPFIRDGALAWDAPAGTWAYVRFTWVYSSTGRALVDGASKECADWYVQTVYQPHYDRFKDAFGTDIVGYFYDEPETHGDWGTELGGVLAERGVDWKKTFVAWKLKLAGEEQAAARYQYQDALAETWGRTLYGGITRWCREHGVQSIGHFLEHGNGYLNPELCAGDLFKLMKYSDMGGIDAVFRQFATGRRVAQDHPIWQTPKLGSSITHAYGKPDDVTMVEIFGARGQDLTYPEMKWWTDHMHVSGVNFLIPHSFNPRAPRDTDCPPYFYNGGFEPRWPLYRVFADYTSRLSVMLSGGRHVCPVALLYLGVSAHVGKHVTPEHMSEVLQDALYDCDWLPFEVFERDCAIAGHELRLRAERYKILIVPPVEVIPFEVMEKARAFFEAGGTVVGYGFLPTLSATIGRTAEDIGRLRAEIWGAPQPGLGVCKTSTAGGRSYLLPEKPTPEQIAQVFARDAGIRPTLEVVEGRTDNWLHVLHRVKAGCDIFFVCNQNHAGEASNFRFRIAASGEPECWDALRNEVTAVPYARSGDRVEIGMTLEPYESVLLVFRPARRPLPARLGAGGAAPALTIPLTRDPTPPRETPTLELSQGIERVLEGCSWVWYPEGDPVASAPAGRRFFRATIAIPEGRRAKTARFVGTADNSFVLFVNGKEAGRSDDSANGWSNPVDLDVTAFMLPGKNQLAIAATNATDKPSPAGCIGRLIVEFESGAPFMAAVDKTWKASRDEAAGWSAAGFDDASWPAAKEVAPFGGGPWGRLAGQGVTLSPVAAADPFYGHAVLPATVDMARSRIYLEMDDLAPERAARVTVNGTYAGGFIERPLRLDVTRHLKPGRNDIILEPFAPPSARLAVYGR